MRAALNTLAEVAPTWLRGHLSPEWIERYGPRFEEYRLPETSAQQQELALCNGADGYALLAALDAPTTPEELPHLPVLQTFRRIWIQHYTRQDRQVIFREEKDTPPAALRIHSIYEPDARYSTKRTATWTGYKVHLTETCEEDAPNLITHVETTPATTLDAAVVEVIHTDLSQKERLPTVHLVDAGYVDAERLVQSQSHGVMSAAREAAELFRQMIAECRALGLGLIVGEQSASQIDPNVMVNTSTKIICSERSPLFSPQEQETLAFLTRGEALTFLPDAYQPIILNIPKWEPERKRDGTKDRFSCTGAEESRARQTKRKGSIPIIPVWRVRSCSRPVALSPGCGVRRRPDAPYWRCSHYLLRSGRAWSRPPTLSIRAQCLTNG